MEKDILLVDKPKGVTSFDVLRQIKRDRNDSKLKLGHAGTLDPNATGLLVIGVGDGTKKLKEYVGLDKTYKAEILLGIKTDSGDITGEILEEKKDFNIEEEAIITALMGMVGVLRLPVSKYSAMKQGGEALYKKVRAGKKFIIPFRDMEVRAVSDIKIESDLVYVTFDVGSGTYIRSLAEELGNRLGIPATLKNLHRTKVGEFSVEDAVRL